MISFFSLEMVQSCKWQMANNKNEWAERVQWQTTKNEWATYRCGGTEHSLNTALGGTITMHAHIRLLQNKNRVDALSGSCV
jgi:hypothetical protein